MLEDKAYLILDNDWRLKTAVYIAGIQVYGKQIRELQPPARFAASHTGSVSHLARHYRHATLAQSAERALRKR